MSSMKLKTYAISGLFLTRPTTGMERYAREIIRELDQLIAPYERVSLIAPRGYALDETYANISVEHVGDVPRGNFGGYVWEQLPFASYLRKSRAVGYLPLNFTTARYSNAVVVIHDVNAWTHPEFYTTPKKRAYRALAMMLLRRARAQGVRIITVSAFSEGELRRLGFDAPIDIAAPGLDHVVADFDTALDVQGVEAPFYFALSSATLNKNFEWIIEVAQRLPLHNFVIAGGGDIEAVLARARVSSLPKNVRHLGYVTDEVRNYLYSNCESFLFPSRYEGFGMPPLEAALLGSRVVVSDIEPLREIFGEEAKYVPVEASSLKLGEAGLQEYANSVDIAAMRERFLWRKAARVTLEALRKQSEKTRAQPVDKIGKRLP